MKNLESLGLSSLNNSETIEIQGGKADPITAIAGIITLAATVYGVALGAAYYLGHQAAHEDCGHN